MEPSAFIFSSQHNQYSYNDAKNRPKSRAQEIYAISMAKEKNTKVGTYYKDPVIAPLCALFFNLNLDNLCIDSIDIEEFVYHITPHLLCQFLNEQGFMLNASVFESISCTQLQSMLNDTKLSIYLKRKIENPTHKYSLSHFVQENYFNNNTKNILNIKKEKDNKLSKGAEHFESKTIDIDKYASPTSSSSSTSTSTFASSLLSPSNSIFESNYSHSNHSTPKLFNVSSSLSSSSKPPQNTEIIRNILKGIKNVMLYNANKNINNKMTDKELKKECLSTTKIKEENGEFEFEEYAHKIFGLLRRQFGLKKFKYLYKLYGINQKNKNNIDIEYATKCFWKSLITNSKSGQLFYRSKDNLFIIKALKYDELMFFRHTFLFSYYKYMIINIDSLLTKILGVYRINDIYFMIMKNIHHSVVPAHNTHKVYDLKGSTHKRQATRHKMVLDNNDYNAMNVINANASTSAIDALVELDENYDEEDEETVDNIMHRYSPSWYQPTHNDEFAKINVIKSDEDKFINNIEVWKRSKILKDLDWIQDKQIIKLGKIRSSFFLGQLDNDLKFLTGMNVMDYSLLIGIHFRNQIKKEENNDRWRVGKLFVYEDGGMCYDYGEEENDKLNAIKYKQQHIPQKDAIYYCGIIDFLQQYTAKKKVETFVKGLATDKSKISAIDPDSYAKRLYSFVQKSVE